MTEIEGGALSSARPMKPNDIESLCPGSVVWRVAEDRDPRGYVVTSAQYDSEGRRFLIASASTPIRLSEIADWAVATEVKSFTDSGRERREAVRLLREICGEHGDNDWPDSLHLYDILEKHLMKHLEKKKRKSRG